MKRRLFLSDISRLAAVDIHSNWVNELSANFERPSGNPVAAEFVVTSISWGGDGLWRRHPERR